MNCLKCGKETDGTNVFCQECLQIMERYPVKPGTPIHLPQRTTHGQEKQPVRRKETTAEDITQQLRSLTRWLTAAIAILSILLCITAGMLLHTLNDQQPVGNIGRNYTTDTSLQP